MVIATVGLIVCWSALALWYGVEFAWKRESVPARIGGVVLMAAGGASLLYGLRLLVV